MNNTFRLVLIGIFVAQSLVLYIIEGLLPVPFIAPGAKLGLANLITVIALYTLPKKKRCRLDPILAHSLIHGICRRYKCLLLQRMRSNFQFRRHGAVTKNASVFPFRRKRRRRYFSQYRATIGRRLYRRKSASLSLHPRTHPYRHGNRNPHRHYRRLYPATSKKTAPF